MPNSPSPISGGFRKIVDVFPAGDSLSFAEIRYNIVEARRCTKTVDAITTLIDATLLDGYCRTILAQIASCEVANRHGRLAPRLLKRRAHWYNLMQKSRDVLTNELRKRRT